jgi:hypothetical protein
MERVTYLIALALLVCALVRVRHLVAGGHEGAGLSRTQAVVKNFEKLSRFRVLQSEPSGIALVRNESEGKVRYVVGKSAMSDRLFSVEVNSYAD